MSAFIGLGIDSIAEHSDVAYEEKVTIILNTPFFFNT